MDQLKLTNETHRRFLASLQALRFLAATMVLISHLLLESRTHPGGTLVDPTRMKWVGGVDIFFVISGFIMYYLTADRFNVRGFAASFIKNRFVRVVPLYWFFSTAFIVMALLAKDHIKNSAISPLRVLCSYLFLPLPREDGTFYPVFEIGWTLNFEIFFYAAFSLALLFPKRRGITGLCALFIILGAVGLATRTQVPFAMFYTRPIIIEFLFGIAVAHLFLRAVRLPALLRWVLMAVGVAGFLAAGNTALGDDVYLRFLWGGVPAALLVAGAVLGSDLKLGRWYTNALVIGGNISYSLYLTHMFSVRFVTILWTKLHLPTGVPIFLASFIAAMLGAYVAYRLVEQPLLRIMRGGGIWQSRKSTTA